MKTAIRTALLAATVLTAFDAGAQVLRVNIPMDPPHISPIPYQENVSFRVISDIYEGFVASTPEGGNVPALATSWTALPAGKHGFQFKLRPNVTFHTGRPFTAKDVKATFELVLDPKWKGGNNVQFLQTVIGAAEIKAGTRTDLPGVRVVDDLTVEVEFTQPNVVFPYIPIQFFDTTPAKELGADWVEKGSAGTGPRSRPSAGPAALRSRPRRMPATGAGRRRSRASASWSCPTPTRCSTSTTPASSTSSICRNPCSTR